MSAAQRIVLFGTESTGKTMLAQMLAAHFGEPWAPEFVREFWDAHGGMVTVADLDAIARGQMANEEAAAARARRVIFCDTDLLMCTIWDDLLFAGACPPWVRAEAERRSKSYALYLLCEADVPFAPDPQRSFSDDASRASSAEICRAALVSRGLPFVTIRGAWAEREKAAIAAVEKILR